jgi:DNA-binding transcriptional MerR regulator
MKEFSLKNLDPVLIEKIQNQYVRIFERKASLRLTRVKRRNFYHWKEEGIIDWFVEEKDDKRSWVRLNVYDFIWVKIIQASRDFGVPIEAIKKLKDDLFLDYINLINNDKEAYLDYSRNELNASDEALEQAQSFLDYASKHKEEIVTHEERHLVTVFGMLVNECLFMDLNALIVFTKQEDTYSHECIFHSPKYGNISNKEGLIFKEPMLIIPVNSLIREFLQEDDNLPNLIYWGILNPKEVKVLEAIRNEDFTSIHVKRRENDEFIIECTQDADIVNEKAKELRRILGLKKYDEITIKFRNDKHLFVKNTRRI